MKSLYKITPHIKNYSWGSQDSNSWVGKIALSIGNNQKPYAEAWYGDHRNGPSLVDGKNIENVLKGKLDFLGKILSIARPLSIQVHPNKIMAKELHQQLPEEFKDAHAKEEGAVALSQLDIAHSLLNKSQIRERIKNFPELLLLLGEKEVFRILDSEETNPKDLLKKILECSKEEIKRCCQQLWSRLEKKETNLLTKYLIKLEQLYPEGDVGIFVLILMNIIRLEPGQAIHTPTGCPHAYLEGELIEIMEPSDNVLRCGLTEKKIDCDNFIKSINSEQNTVGIIQPKQEAIILGNLCIQFLSSGSTIFTGNKPKIVVSLDASGEIKCANGSHSFHALSSFLVTENKTIDIKFDSGRIISFGNR